MRLKMMLIGLVVLAVTLSGCTSDGGTDGTATEPPAGETPPGGDTTAGMVAPPGLYEQADGTTQALGILAYRDLEGGFWAVVETVLPEEADTAAVVAVILPDNDIAGVMESFKGKYVSVIGNREDGPNIYQVGAPLIEGKTIEEVTDTVVE